MKIKFLIAALFFSLVAAAQPSNYINFRSRERWIAGKADSTFHIPAMATNSLKTGGYTGAGAIVYNTTDSSVYTWTGYQWIKLGSEGWALTGNEGTDATTNFIGTTDSVDLVFKSNNAEIMRLKRASTGRVGIGTSNPAAKLNVLSTTEQLRLSYDATNVFRITVESDGRTILWPVGSNAQLYMSGFIQGAQDMALYGTTTWGIGITT